MEDFEVLHETPSPEDYFRLRKISGLTPKSREAIARGLPNTLFGVIVRHKADSKVVGMGRLVGDGGLFVQVVDIAVEPAYQGRGIGKTIMQTIMDWVKKELFPSAYVSLIADGEAYRLYEQYGFELTAPRSVGMAICIQ
ncbi:hypothetical protein TWF225_010385 [Orbilia oligospora]|uniref:Uncharacterized protein n=1 Tax=Orbilia oligospora TaxID=2813651 RepID=A0A7C8P8H2_ORBOL|nr:hypothetical protein TWF751_010072 [Orbilia oligospora]KAF3172283.1 hypothetical protein TWF225_010385 [Orbilia oligospora]KAF3243733.1 hypothetical protein TWF128_009932 [Orbilia oligospora]KAF3250514.1 hypothetical protein TWF217_008556 [Orbilia oligospora]KAF3294867.1 hypothetical protein TWF132_002788 [Orbilia oligospora]